MGWGLAAYKGQILSQHGGNLDGFSSLTSLIPAANVGIVVLCNGNGTALPTVLTYQLYDQLLDLPATDWNGRLKPLWDEMRAGEKASHARSSEQRQADAGPSHPLDAYVGEYEHPGYGVLAIRPAGEHAPLKLVINDTITLPLQHYHYDHFEAYWEKWDNYQKLSFATDSNGMISQLTTQMEPKVRDITFVRRPERRWLEAANLEPFVGTYEALGMPLAVSLVIDKGGRGFLRMSFAGESAETLVPYRGTEFQVQGRSGFSIEFKQDGEGKVAEAIIAQPGAVFSATRREPSAEA